MHESSMITMRKFVEDNDLEDGQTVVDIGSLDINGTYRLLFQGSKYIGADIMTGANVDILVGLPEWDALENVDAVISGQTLEHIEDIPLFMAGIMRILKPGGLLCIIAPNAGMPHHYPAWVGHFSIERMSGVVKDAGFEIESCTIDTASEHQDCCCIARKPTEAKMITKKKSMRESMYVE